jgi:ABC-type uncharacterized transport system auxiliary subunit
MRRLVVIALVMLAPACVAGCKLKQPYPGKSYYVLDAASGDAPVTSAAESRVIRVPRAAVAPPFASRALQYKVAPSRFEPSYWDNWADDPGALVATAASETLAATGGFIILPDGRDAAGCESLELQVTALYIDVTGAAPTAVVGLRASLLDAAGAVRLSRDLERTEPAASSDGADVVRAFNAALQGMLGELAAEIRGAVG